MLPKNSSRGPLQRIHCNAAVLRVSLSLREHFEGHCWIDLVPFHVSFWWEETKDAGSASCCSANVPPLLMHLLEQHFSVSSTQIHREKNPLEHILKYILFFQMGFNLICKNILTDCWIILQVYRDSVSAVCPRHRPSFFFKIYVTTSAMYSTAVRVKS